MSRNAASDRLSVRGIGVAVMVRTSTSAQFLSRSFWRTPKRCSSSEDDKPEAFETDVLLQQAVGANDDVHRALSQFLNHVLLLALAAETR